MRTELIKRVDDLKLRMNSELESLRSEHKSGNITLQQYNEKYKYIVDKYRTMYDQTVSFAQGELDIRIQELNMKRTNSLSENNLSRDRKLVELDQQYASKTIPIPATFRQSINV